MNRILLFLFFGLILFIGSCFEPPKFSKIPVLTFEKVKVKEVAGTTTPDSMIVTVSFKDGDGNIGLGGDEIDPPYNERWFYLLSTNPSCEPGVTAPCKRKSFFDASNRANYVSYSLRRTNPDYDTLPEFLKPNDCLKYFVVRDANNVPTDTLYSTLNPRYNNFFVDIMVKNGASSFKYEFNNQGYPKCDVYGLNGRLPILAKDGNPDNEIPLEGIITYRVVSASFYRDLRNKTISIRVWLMDRDGNVSNVVESDEFTLN